MASKTRTFYCPRDGTAVECFSPFIACKRDATDYRGTCSKCNGSLHVTHGWRNDGLDISYIPKPMRTIKKTELDKNFEKELPENGLPDYSVTPGIFQLPFKWGKKTK